MSKFIRIHRGNSAELVFSVKQPDGKPFDLTGVTDIRFGISKNPKQSPYLVKVMGDGVSVHGFVDGKVSVMLGPEDTNDLGTRVYELLVGFNGDVYTGAIGDIEFAPSIFAED